MAGIVRYAGTGMEAASLEEVARWAEAFHPDVTVTLDEDCACLASDVRDEEELRRIWLSSLSNEQLRSRATECRAAILAELAR